MGLPGALGSHEGVMEGAGVNDESSGVTRGVWGKSMMTRGFGPVQKPTMTRVWF